MVNEPSVEVPVYYVFLEKYEKYQYFSDEKSTSFGTMIITTSNVIIMVIIEDKFLVLRKTIKAVDKVRCYFFLFLENMSWVRASTLLGCF